MEAILDSLDNHGKKLAFENNFAKLKVSQNIDFDALAVCIRLLEPVQGDSDNATVSLLTPLLHEQLWLLLESRISSEEKLDNLYAIAQACLSHGDLAAHIEEQTHLKLTQLLEQVKNPKSWHDDEENSQEAISYLRFLMCSFWLPKDYFHLVNTGTIALLSGFLGIDRVDSAAHDALSTLFSLIKTEGKLMKAQTHSRSGATDGLIPTQNHLIVDEALWLRLKTLQPNHFTSNTSKIFRTWFQWISQMVLDSIEPSCIYDDLYWNRLRMGLVNGFADQRKYCLGIIHQSLLAARKGISTTSMRYDMDKGNLFLKAYQNFSTLFETIVLNRYPKQVEACLPELTVLFGANSIITASMLVALLTAALDPKIQEGIRKLVGNWYMKNVINSQLRTDAQAHLEFVFEGLFPWAIEGSLFTSTLVTTRETTKSTHGITLVEFITKFVSGTPENERSTISEVLDDSVSQRTNSRCRDVTLGIIRFVLKVGNSLFKPSALYLLEGRIKGLESYPERFPLKECISPTEFNEIVRLSSLTGFPEIANDLWCIYCGKICGFVVPEWQSYTVPGCSALTARVTKLQRPVDQGSGSILSEICNDSTPLKRFLERLRKSRVEFIQGANYVPACNTLIEILDQSEASLIDRSDLYDALEALWDEAERRGFIRPVVLHLPPLLFHPVCIEVAIFQYSGKSELSNGDLTTILTTALKCFQKLSQSRLYVVAAFAKFIRRAVLSNFAILDILPIQDYVLDFVNYPPAIRSEFLFEVAAAENLQQILPQRTFGAYYGLREWHAYAAIIDLIQRLRARKDVAKSILDRLLEPWENQKAPIPVKSPWKETFQLQAMLILSDYCIADSEVTKYIESFMKPLAIEHWPRYRHLLEWIVARMYCKSPEFISQQLDQIGNIDDYSPIHIASLIKLGLLVAPYSTEDFAIIIATHLACFSASPKVQIRHEAQFAFPYLFDLAQAKGWKSIAENIAFKGLNTFIRKLEKFKAAAWTIRTLKVNVQEDFTLTNIFQGQYLSIESPEAERVTREDFITLQAEDMALNLPPALVPLGQLRNTQIIVQDPVTATNAWIIPDSSTVPVSTFLQTKASFDLNSLHPNSGTPDMQLTRPSSVILVASLIDNPTNLGGLSRISESFGVESMHVHELKHLGHKDFKATSVTSEKHFPIHELKENDVPSFLITMKRSGYEAVGIEQTDRSAVLGQDDNVEEQGDVNAKVIGTLPNKCVLVLGSEKQGVSAKVLAVLDRCVEIKTVGVTRSLNVQTAGGIVLYEWWRLWGDRKRSIES